MLLDRQPRQSTISRVTVVVATYNRPDVLQVALRSALSQGAPVAEVIVIGDNCDPRTEAACASLYDPRIRYINLPARFGEQSGPNSIGMLIADTEFVAFLNHDDIMLPGHLDIALEELTRSGADLYIGRAAHSDEVGIGQDGRPMPLFSSVHAEHRELTYPMEYVDAIEPASAWVFRRDLADRVGPWRPASTIYRPPIQDWVLRAWRGGIRIVFGSVLSVLKVTPQYGRVQDVPAYNTVGPEHANLEKWIGTVGVDRARRTVLAEVATATAAAKTPTVKTPTHTWMRRLARGWRERGLFRGFRWVSGTAIHQFRQRVLRSKLSARVFRLTGIDLYAVIKHFSMRNRRAILERVAQLRTGIPLPDPPDIADMIEYIATLPTNGPHVDER